MCSNYLHVYRCCQVTNKFLVEWGCRWVVISICLHTMRAIRVKEFGTIPLKHENFSHHDRRWCQRMQTGWGDLYSPYWIWGSKTCLKWQLEIVQWSMRFYLGTDSRACSWCQLSGHVHLIEYRAYRILLPLTLLGVIERFVCPSRKRRSFVGHPLLTFIPKRIERIPEDEPLSTKRFQTGLSEAIAQSNLSAGRNGTSAHRHYS